MKTPWSAPVMRGFVGMSQASQVERVAVKAIGRKACDALRAKGLVIAEDEALRAMIEQLSGARRLEAAEVAKGDELRLEANRQRAICGHLLQVIDLLRDEADEDASGDE